MYKHLASQHNKSKTEYLKMSKAIRNNAFIDEKENEVEETPPKLHFVKARPPEEAMQVDFHQCSTSPIIPSLFPNQIKKEKKDEKGHILMTVGCRTQEVPLSRNS